MAQSAAGSFTQTLRHALLCCRRVERDPLSFAIAELHQERSTAMRLLSSTQLSILSLIIILLVVLLVQQLLCCLYKKVDNSNRMKEMTGIYKLISGTHRKIEVV